MLDLDDVKLYLKVDYDDEDEIAENEDRLIEACLSAAIMYLKNATGVDLESESDNELAKIYVLKMVADMYERRAPSAEKSAGFVDQSILLQLSLREEG